MLLRVPQSKKNLQKIKLYLNVLKIFPSSAEKAVNEEYV